MMIALTRNSPAVLRDFRLLANYGFSKHLAGSQNLENSEVLSTKAIYPEIYRLRDLTYTLFYKYSRGLINQQMNKTDTKKLSIYPSNILSLEHKQQQRALLQQIAKYKENDLIVRCNEIRERMGKDLQKFFQSGSQKFALNFFQFKNIFYAERPVIFYDIIQYLGLFEFRNVEYPERREAVARRIDPRFQENQNDQVFKKSKIEIQLDNLLLKYEDKGPKAIENMWEDLNKQRRKKYLQQEKLNLLRQKRQYYQKI